MHPLETTHQQLVIKSKPKSNTDESEHTSTNHTLVNPTKLKSILTR